MWRKYEYDDQDKGMKIEDEKKGQKERIQGKIQSLERRRAQDKGHEAWLEQMDKQDYDTTRLMKWRSKIKAWKCHHLYRVNDHPLGGDC